VGGSRALLPNRDARANPTCVESQISGRVHRLGTSNAQNNRPNCLIINAFALNRGAIRFGPVIFGHREKIRSNRIVSELATNWTRYVNSTPFTEDLSVNATNLTLA